MGLRGFSSRHFQQDLSTFYVGALMPVFVPGGGGGGGGDLHYFLMGL